MIRNRSALAGMLAFWLLSSAATGEDYAFLVGVKDYDAKQLRALTYSRDDIVAFRDVLVGAGFKPENVVLMHDDLKTLPNARFLADSTRIREELKLVLDAVEPEDTLVIAFAGHGVQFKGEADNFFCPLDAKLTDRTTLISLKEIYDRLKSCPSRQKLLLVDACRNDPASVLARTSGSPDLETVTQPQLTPPPAGVVALFSCAEGQQAFEHPDLKHGIFFYHVLEGWKGSADDGDQELTLDEIIAYTKSKTKTYARLTLGASQTPRQQGFFDGEWILCKLPAPLLQQITNSIGMKLQLVPAGEFQMGSNETRESLQSAGFRLIDSFDPTDEHPMHPVQISKRFYLGVHEVTKGQFAAFILNSGYVTEAEQDGKGGWGHNSTTNLSEQKPVYNWMNTGFAQTDSHPVVNVTWNDAAAFCEWLSRKEGKSYRLPTEAEWEYACRAGTETRFFPGNDPVRLQGYANVMDASFEAKHPKVDFANYPSFKFDDGWAFASPVGRFQPNRFGLYDMHCNAWEWCADWYGSDFYQSSPASDPQGPSSGSLRVVRGGGWNYTAGECRSARRDKEDPSSRGYVLGFRLILSSSGP